MVRIIPWFLVRIQVGPNLVYSGHPVIFANSREYLHSHMLNVGTALVASPVSRVEGKH